MEQRYAIEDESGEQLSVIRPTYAFFELASSLSTSRFVPLNIAAMIASLYTARSDGVVKSSTVSSESSSCLSLGLLKLWICTP